ncbi:MAG: hypothetical protein EXR79_10845 [Myxococcales bacterium]|nr:hypothetical protein [Myxococcales bacterium]
MGRTFSLVCFLAAAVSACAQTGTPGGGVGAADTKTGATADTGAGAADTAKTGDVAATTADGATPAGDGAGAPLGGEKTIGDLQKHESSLKCPNTKGIFNVASSKGTILKGAVVVSPKRTSGTLDNVYVQAPGGGAWNGILVVAKKDTGLKDVKQGDVLTIIGEVKEFYCLTEIEALTVTVESQGTGLPSATTVDVDLIGDKGKDEDKESFESVLVHLEGVVVAEPMADKGTDGKYHAIAVGKTEADQTLLIGSGMGGIFMQDSGNKALFQKGQKLNINGFLDYSFEKFRIVPIKLDVQK